MAPQGHLRQKHLTVVAQRPGMSPDDVPVCLPHARLGSLGGLAPDVPGVW